MKNLEVVSLLKNSVLTSRLKTKLGSSLEVSKFKDGESCFKLASGVLDRDIVLLQVV